MLPFLGCYVISDFPVVIKSLHKTRVSSFAQSCELSLINEITAQNYSVSSFAKSCGLSLINEITVMNKLININF